MYLLICQVKVTIGDLDLCCCVCDVFQVQRTSGGVHVPCIYLHAM